MHKEEKLEANVFIIARSLREFRWSLNVQERSESVTHRILLGENVFYTSYYYRLVYLKLQNNRLFFFPSDF